MWHHKFLFRIDLRLILILFSLMIISLLVISSMTMPIDSESGNSPFLSFFVKSQIKRYAIGWLLFFFFAGFDYKRLKDYSYFLYFFTCLCLLGIFFVVPIQGVHRWYKIPFLGFHFQPSEYAKIILIITLGFFLEKKKEKLSSFSTTMQLAILAFIPFFLILKQPDLGSALVFFPITLIMSYVAGVNKVIMKIALFFTFLGILLTTLIFTNVLSHEKMQPFFTKFLKEYQYSRLNPNTYHQNASKVSIAIGGVFGSGWKKSNFASKRWLPASHTDSVFAAFLEEFGLVGGFCLLLLFFFLIYLSFNVAWLAKDDFGKFLASGIAVYLSMHIILNIAMMCGFLPISGVPLVLITYGGSSVVVTMAALGILQSIYTRRFMF